MKVLLALPIREGVNTQIAPDLGILYLGTVLLHKGFDVTLLDCPKDSFSFEDFRTFLQEHHFDVVGFRCYSRDHNYVNHHLNIVRQVSPHALTLMGGPHPSALPEFVLSSMPNLDLAWKAEAEEGLPELLSCFEEYGREMPEGRLEKIPGLVWRSQEKGQTVVNPPGFTADLDSYGIPAWHLLRPETYPGFIWDEYYPISTTRGCPFPCTYCNTPGLSGKKLRHRSVEHVIQELSFLKNRYAVRRFSIIDDEFTLARKYTTRFCQALIESDLELKWDIPAGVRLDSLDPELMKIMEAAGCEAMAVGIESGNERIQRLINKRVTVETIREKAAQVAGCTQIRMAGYFMIGFLDETEAEIMDTIRLAAELPLQRANFNLVIPIPGTAIFQELLQEGLLKLGQINWDSLTCDQVAFPRRHVSGRRLLELQKHAYSRFYGRPGIIWDVGKEMLKNRELLWRSLQKLRMFARRNETYSFTPMYLREKLA
ncbi:MAG: radical SAM protein [Acidobacteria bacterium]|nr:radical SAM protein [Acidobacteriota bacterium]